MAKVHPNAAAVAAAEPATPAAGATGQEPDPEPPTVLTVWRKSLLFNCDGFTVYDAHGDLAFRVDCYAASRRRHAEVVLMDTAGTPLLTVRRKRLSLAERWDIYDGADAAGNRRPPLLSVRRHVGSLHASGGGKTLAHVAAAASSSSTASSDGGAFVVEGSYCRRACAVRDARGDVVAEVRRKEGVGDDVFRLVWSVPALVRRSSSPSTRCSAAAARRARGSWLRGPC